MLSPCTYLVVYFSSNVSVPVFWYQMCGIGIFFIHSCLRGHTVSAVDVRPPEATHTNKTLLVWAFYLSDEATVVVS